MTSVRVNLLPREFEERGRERRRAVLSYGALLLVLAGLGFLWFLKQGSVETARIARDEAQAEVARLQAEVAELRQFQELATQLQNGEQVLTFAMAGEVSFARLLNDLALAFPATASLTSLSATLEAPDTAATGEDAGIDPGPSIGTLSFTGYSIERYAPGVETVIIDFSRIRDLLNAFLETAAAAEIGDVGVTNFTGTANVAETALTGRYAEGLPPEGLQ